MFEIKNSLFILINGANVYFGEKCITEDGDHVYLTLKEIETLKEQSKIIETGWRQLAYICLFEINEMKVDRPIPLRYIEQLSYMGYDVDSLSYELKTE